MIQTRVQREWVAAARRMALLVGPIPCKRCAGQMLVDDAVIDGIGWRCLLCGEGRLISVPIDDSYKDIPKAGPGRPLDPLRRAIVVDLLRGGVSHLEVVRQAGVTRQAVAVIKRELEREPCA